MKKVLLAIALSLPSLANADQFCIMNFDKGRCEGAYSEEVSGLNFCAPYTEGDLGDLLFSICDDGLFFASSYSKCKSDYNALSASYTTAQKNLNDCIAYSANQASAIANCNLKYNLLAIDYGSLKSKSDSIETELGSLKKDYNALYSNCTANEDSRKQWIAYGNAQSNLAKRLRKACGSKCKRIK